MQKIFGRGNYCACNRASHNYWNRMAVSREEGWRERKRERGWRARNSANPARVGFSVDKGVRRGVRRGERWKYRVIDAGLISISVSADWLDGPVNQPISHAYWSRFRSAALPPPPCFSKNRTVSLVNLCPICVPPLLFFQQNNKRDKIDGYIYIYICNFTIWILNFEYDKFWEQRLDSFERLKIGWIINNNSIALA